MITAAEFLKWLAVFNVDYGPNPGSGTVSPGTAGQLAFYNASGTTVSGTNAIPAGTTATTPTTNSQVATKQYVDDVAAGLPPAGAVQAASTTNYPATYYNGADDDGIGATLT